MPSIAETQAAQRRARGRVMAMAAIIQTGQPDSLVLLPPSSAGETRAVGERWPARVVWASDTRAARGLTCCRASVCCADGVEDFTRQRAELAAIFALGTPQLPTGRVLQGPPQFTLGDAFDELGCECSREGEPRQAPSCLRCLHRPARGQYHGCGWFVLIVPPCNVYISPVFIRMCIITSATARTVYIITVFINKRSAGCAHKSARGRVRINVICTVDSKMQIRGPTAHQKLSSLTISTSRSPSSSSSSSS